MHVVLVLHASRTPQSPTQCIRITHTPEVEALVVQPARAKPLIARAALAVRPFCDLRLACGNGRGPWRRLTARPKARDVVFEPRSNAAVAETGEDLDNQ
jgi:hypothetical protein